MVKRGIDWSKSITWIDWSRCSIAVLSADPDRSIKVILTSLLAHVLPFPPYSATRYDCQARLRTRLKAKNTRGIFK
eukprot:1558823-Pyramimonas_sp.AAC.1